MVVVDPPRQRLIGKGVTIARVQVTRARIAAAAAVLALAVLAGLGLWTGRGGDAVSDLAGRLDLVEPGPLELRLGGRLWNDRTTFDDEGAPDLAYVSGDEPLTVQVTTRQGHRPRSLRLTIDGRTRQHRKLCAAFGCRRPARIVLRPPLRGLRPGRHRIVVSARAAGGKPTVTTRFDITIARRLPRLREAEALSRRGESPDPAITFADASVRRQARIAIARARRRDGLLARVAPAVTTRTVAVGRLTDHGRPTGETTLLRIARPRPVHGLLVPSGSRGAGSVRFSSPALRDLLVDTTGGRVVAVEPGPDSQTSSWDGPKPPASAKGLAPAGRIRLVRLSDRGPAFLNYDGGPNFAAGDRDWPVSLIFTGHATIAKVKRNLRAIGLTRRGGTRYLAYSTAGASPRFDGDRGLKTPCDRNGADLHLRLYAPSRSDRFVDPEYGSFVVATTHFDRGDGCGGPPKLFGFSERAERLIATRIARRLHWTVHPDAIALGNAEPYRRDVTDPSHIWWGDGLATTIDVP